MKRNFLDQFNMAEWIEQALTPPVNRNRRMSFDQKCYDLAIAFLEDHYGVGQVPEDKANELAQDIQRSIEDFMGALK
jgi:hypothetical protein